MQVDLWTKLPRLSLVSSPFFVNGKRAHIVFQAPWRAVFSCGGVESTGTGKSRADNMTNLQRVQVAIESLSDEEFGQLRRWLSEKDWEQWDREIAQDAASGKLDFLVEEALNEKSKGQLREL